VVTEDYPGKDLQALYTELYLMAYANAGNKGALTPGVNKKLCGWNEPGENQGIIKLPI